MKLPDFKAKPEKEIKNDGGAITPLWDDKRDYSSDPYIHLPEDCAVKANPKRPVKN